MFRLEGCAKATQGCRGVELVDLPPHLLADELSLEVCQNTHVSIAPRPRLAQFSQDNLQCSCLPVSVWPGSGTLSCLSIRKGSSTVFVDGSTAPPSWAFAESPAAMTSGGDAGRPKT